MRGTVAVLLLLFAVTAPAADTAVKRVGGPPEAIAAALRGLLPEEGVAVEIGGKAAAEFWIRRGFDQREGGAAKLGVELGGMAEGSLVGAARFPEGFSDYMGNKVPPGVYTLRYAVQPADGNHMGVSIHRDFLLLVRAADDAGVTPLSYADLVAASRQATGTKHPAVLSLFPVAKDVAVGTVSRNELDQPVLAVESGTLRFGLVLEGEGEK